MIRSYLITYIFKARAAVTLTDSIHPHFTRTVIVFHMINFSEGLTCPRFSFHELTRNRHSSRTSVNTDLRVEKSRMGIDGIRAVCFLRMNVNNTCSVFHDKRIQTLEKILHSNKYVHICHICH